MLSFTKNKQTGKYDVIGLASELSPGRVKVSKKDGTTTEVYVSKVTKPFVAKFGPLEGKKCVIGTVAKSCVVCGVVETTNSRGYTENRIYKSGECQDCYEERKMGY